ncbi:hypothetical protein G7046_g2766 [Stylonectria norvegica]|nr:hypothetical protein G7046_g2766 [Stylonectria norvegica]
MAPQILILDGGLGTSLEQKYNITFGRTTPLWSSDLLVTDQPTLQACQRDFGDIPVDIILTATYQVSDHAFAGTKTEEFPHGIGPESIPRFLDDAVTIAEAAKHRDARVALSIGPYGACMIPGQEYSGNYDSAHDTLIALEEWHRNRMQLFAEIPKLASRVGYVALETIPRVDEIIAMRKALASVPVLASLPFWMTFLSPGDEMSLPKGASVEVAVAAMLDPQISASVPWGIGINCTKVQKVDHLLRLVEGAISRLVEEGRIATWPALVLYPDGTNGEVYNTTTQKWEMVNEVKGEKSISWETQLAEVHHPALLRHRFTSPAAMAPKVFIVTGASKGIGAAITQYLLSQGHQVVVTARSQHLLEELKKSHPDQVEYIAGDMVGPKIATQLTELAVKSFGKIDGIVINHGILLPKKFADHTAEDWLHVYDVNVFSGIMLARAGLEELRQSKGCLLWVSSGAATKAYQAWGSYGSSKAAVNSISAHIAIDEPEITSVAIAPGRVDTEMQGLLRAEGKESMNKAQYENFAEAYENGTLLRAEQPGRVMAKFVVNPLRELSGKAFSWNSPEVAAYQE